MPDILDSFKSAKSALSQTLQSHGLEMKSAGTKSAALSEATDPSTGYWTSPSTIAQKPLRWILQLTKGNGTPKVSLAKDEAGSPLTAATTLGIANNSAGTAAVFGCRIMLAVLESVQPRRFEFPAGWEWILLLIFPAPLPAGTSGQLMSSFNRQAGTVEYVGPRKVAHVALVPQRSLPGNATTPTGTVTYIEATDAIRKFLADGALSVSVHDPNSSEEMLQLSSRVEAALQHYLSGGPVEGSNASAALASDAVMRIEDLPASLIGMPVSILSEINAALAIGKRHFIFYGPPGTGKTTLAEAIAAQIADSDEDEGGYVLLTASSAWSGQDLIGGYQPLGDGKVGFVPGALLRNFDKPLIIDEMNRCPIDKVIGPLFSVLSGQVSTLPYRTDIANPNSNFYSILPKPKADRREYEFAPGARWHLLCTLNTIDRTQLGQISYALSRRFCWIRVGVPENLADFVQDVLVRDGFLSTKNSALPNPIAEMWTAVNKVREIGGAPIIDLIRLARKMSEGVDLLASPNDASASILARAMTICVLPLLDGIDRSEAEALALDVEKAWRLTPPSSLRRDILSLAL